jgi:hypothetical protein
VGAAPTNVGPFATGDYNRETGLVGDGSTKYINTNFTAVMLYDRNQDAAVQWSQVLAVGVLFQL